MSPKTLFILFFVLVNNSYEYQINDINCGLKSPKKFIIGGRDVPNELPFVVLILMNNRTSSCTGTAISSGYVLTAAHCINSREPEDYELHSGISNGTYFWDYIEIDQIIVNGCYKEDSESDIALLRLWDFKVEGNETICLPPKNAEPINATVHIGGYGIYMFKEDKNGERKPRSPGILQVTQTKLYSEEFCQYYIYFYRIGLSIKPVTNLGNKLCLKSETSTACLGDSGGPAFQEVNGKWYQIGISSYLINPSWQGIESLCSKGIPNVYVKTSKYKDWIEKSINEYKNSNETMITTKC